jgi:integrase
MMRGIYPCGNGFQVKLRRKGLPDITGTFPTADEAIAYKLRVLAADRVGQVAPPVDEALTGSDKMTIEELFRRVDRKRWRGNPKAKSGELGSCANAIRFVAWAGPKRFAGEALSEELIEDFIDHRETNLGNSGSTINRYIAALSALAKEAVKLKLIPAKPDMPHRPEGSARMRVYTTAEEQEILVTARQWGYHDLADWFVVLCDTGARPKELYLLEWADISNGHLHLDGAITKNSTARTLKATPRVLEALERMKARKGNLKGPFAWISSRDRAPRSLWNRLRGHLDWMDRGTVIYTYRHTCASRLVQRGVDLFRVQIWMGHKSLSMTQRYAKFAPRHMDELAAALEGRDRTSPDPSLAILSKLPPDVIAALVKQLGLQT